MTNINNNDDDDDARDYKNTMAANSINNRDYNNIAQKFYLIFYSQTTTGRHYIQHTPLTTPSLFFI